MGGRRRVPSPSTLVVPTRRSTAGAGFGLPGGSPVWSHGGNGEEVWGTMGMQAVPAPGGGASRGVSRVAPEAPGLLVRLGPPRSPGCSLTGRVDKKQKTK